MKKFISVLAIAMVCLICVFGLTACGDRALDGRYKTVEAYLADPIVNATLEASMGESTDDLSIEILGDGSNLIYQYTFTDTFDEATLEIMKSSLESGTASMESSMVDIANSLTENVAADNLAVVVRYLDANGTLIYEATFNADK